MHLSRSVCKRFLIVNVHSHVYHTCWSYHGGRSEGAWTSHASRSRQGRCEWKRESVTETSWCCDRAGRRAWLVRWPHSRYLPVTPVAATLHLISSICSQSFPHPSHSCFFLLSPSSFFSLRYKMIFSYFFSTVSLVCVYSINQLVSSVCLSVCLSHRQFPTVLVHPRTTATPDDHLILPYYLHHLQEFYAHDVGRKKFHCWWTLPEIWQVA